MMGAYDYDGLMPEPPYGCPHCEELREQLAAAEARVDKAESALQWIEQHGGIALVAKAIAVAKTEENNDS